MGMSASSESPEINAHVLDVIVSSLVQFDLFELYIGISLGLVDGGFHYAVDAVFGVPTRFGCCDLFIPFYELLMSFR
jgi:hypothetical protein